MNARDLLQRSVEMFLMLAGVEEEKREEEEEKEMKKKDNKVKKGGRKNAWRDFMAASRPCAQENITARLATYVIITQWTKKRIATRVHTQPSPSK